MIPALLVLVSLLAAPADAATLSAPVLSTPAPVHLMDWKADLMDWETEVLRHRQRMLLGTAMLAGAMLVTAPEVLHCRSRSGCTLYYLAFTAPLAIWGGVKVAASLGAATHHHRSQGLTGRPIPYWIGWTGVAVTAIGWTARFNAVSNARPGTLIAAAGSVMAIGGFGTQAVWNATGWFGSGRRALLPRLQITPWLDHRRDRSAAGLGVVGRW